MVAFRLYMLTNRLCEASRSRIKSGLPQNSHIWVCSTARERVEMFATGEVRVDVHIFGLVLVVK
jgi:hypothetical protein